MRQKFNDRINRKVSKIYRPYNRHTMHVQCKNERDTSDSKGQLEPYQRHSENTQSTYRVRAISMNYIEQP